MINDKIKEYTLLAVVLLAVFGVYLHTVFPAFKGDDSPETTAAAYTLGIQHAPGYPLHALLGKIAVTGSLANPAFKMNLLSSFLAVITLLVTYFILTRHIFRFLNMEYTWVLWVLGLGSIGILAFSNIFWNQAIEAKGGIYMLNLLFLSILIMLIFVLFERFDSKYMIFFFYVIGLSLSNHWPSMIILFPVFTYVFYKYRQNFSKRLVRHACLAVVLGLSAYIYLYIRAGANPALNWGNPSTLGNLIDVIMRKMYSAQAEPLTGTVIETRINYIFKSLMSNYWFFWLLALPGFYFVYKKKREIFWMLVSIAAVTAGMLVFYSRTGMEMIWLTGIFLMPAQYILFIFIITGVVFSINPAKNILRKTAAVFAVVISLSLLLNMNIRRNDRHNDYISYDIMYNIRNSVDSKAYYLPEQDMFLMPMFYEKVIQKRSPGLKVFPLPFLLYDWGVKQAQEMFGYFPSKTGDILYNLKGLAGIALQDTGAVYRDFTSPGFDALNLPLFHYYDGLIKCVSAHPYSESLLIYDLYSFRGMFEKFAQADENIEIVTRYLIFMSLHAERLMNLQRYREAIDLYRKALAIPAEKLTYNIYYKMAMSYLAMNDFNDALIYLKKTIENKSDFLPAYESAGRIFYMTNDIFNAHRMFTHAVKSGSNDKIVKELAIKTGAVVRKNEAALDEALKLETDRKYDQALAVYNSLINAEYRLAESLLRAGRILYETGEKEKALEMFIKSNDKVINPEAYYYQAMIYYQKGMYDEAVAAAYEGLTRFKDNENLQKLYSRLKGY
jgi:tetratricopeptide (TPR) repeat protein